VLVFTDVAGVHKTGEHRHGFRGFALGGKVVDKTGHHVAKARHVRANVARRVAVHHDLVVRNFHFVDVGLEVIADGFRKTCGMHGNNVGVIDLKSGLDALTDVWAAAEHAGAFGKGTGDGNGGFLKVTRKVGAVVRSTTLRSVAVRHAVAHAQGGKQRAHRLTGLARVDKNARSVHMCLWGEVKHTILPQFLAGWRGSSRAGLPCATRG